MGTVMFRKVDVNVIGMETAERLRERTLAHTRRPGQNDQATNAFCAQHDLRVSPVLRQST